MKRLSLFVVQNIHRRRYGILVLSPYLRYAARFASILSLQSEKYGQLADGVPTDSRYYRCRFDARGGDPALGFYRFDVTDAGITPTFIPLTEESQSHAGYGPGGHPRPEERDYSLAWEKDEE